MKLVFNLLLAIVFVAEIPVILANDDTIASLVKRMDAIEARNDELEARNEVLSDVNEDLNARIKALEVIATNQQKEINRLAAISEGQLASTKDIADHLEEPTEQARPDDNEGRVLSQDKVRAMSRIRKASNEVSVAFFSVLTDHIENPGVHQAVAFDKVITNVGNAYNPHAGDFRAPVSGVYVFSATLMAGAASVPYHFSIMHNGTQVSRIYIKNGGTASQEAVLQLSQGDDVVIHNIDAGQRLYGHAISTFSGFLLQQDYPEVSIVGK